MKWLIITVDWGDTSDQIRDVPTVNNLIIPHVILHTYNLFSTDYHRL